MGIDFSSSVFNNMKELFEHPLNMLLALFE